MFLLVFALSEGGVLRLAHAHPRRHGPRGAEVWPGDRAVSLIPLVFVVSLRGPRRLLPLRAPPGARPTAGRCSSSACSASAPSATGCSPASFIAMGQLGLLLTLALFLQDAVHLDALHNGLWVLPMGLSILVGALVGGRLRATVGTPRVIRVGLVVQAARAAAGSRCRSARASPSSACCPGLVGYGSATAWATSQLTNVVLSEIPADKSGVAAGTNTHDPPGRQRAGHRRHRHARHHRDRVATRSTAWPRRRDPARRGPRRRPAEQIRAAGTGYRPSRRRPRPPAELGPDHDPVRRRRARVPPCCSRLARGAIGLPC